MQQRQENSIAERRKNNMNEFASKADFARAGVGQPFLECCGCCRIETGSILIKKKAPVAFGSAYQTRSVFDLPRKIVNVDTRCEFCEFLVDWMTEQGKTPEKDGKHGVAKVVERDADGAEVFFAYIPFSASNREIIIEGEQVVVQHGMVILAVKIDEPTRQGVQLKEVISEGMPDGRK